MPHQASNKPTAPKRRRDTRPQVTRNSSKTTFDKDVRPALRNFNLPGPRRAREGRGGAHSSLEVLRYLIRCPLLPALTAAIAPRSAGRPSAYPDVFWVFVCAAHREFASAEQLNEELRNHWVEICKEFYFEHQVTLPTKPGVAYSSFNSWRTNAILDREGQLDLLMERLSTISVPLALAVRRAEGGDGVRDLLNPKVWDCVAADGTVRNAPSDVRNVLDFDDDGEPVVRPKGSRAHRENPERARVHETQQKTHKRSGSTEGLYNVAVTTKGADSYSRTVLAVDIGSAHDAEIVVARRALKRTFDLLGNTIPVLVYDGAVTPVDQQDLLADYGVFTVNANHARNRPNSAGAGESRAKTFDADTETTGEGVHKFGHKRGHLKRTYVTPMADLECTNGGKPHSHHLVADDGALYEVDRPPLKGGTSRRLALVAPSRVERVHESSGEYYFKLTLTGPCAHGGKFSTTQELRRTQLNRFGALGWREIIANIRVIPDAVLDYAEIMGHRNQVESYFSWLEKCYFRQDRAASWGRTAQLFDLICASLLHNAEAWAHLAYRHPEEAARLAEELVALPRLDLSGVKKKPIEHRKRALGEALVNVTVEDLLASSSETTAKPPAEAA
jgi:hypothetical protein